MPGLKTNALSRKEVLAAVRAVPAAKNFVWDGVDEDERPASDEELRAGVAAYRKRGRPAGGATKEQVAIRFDREVLAAFRAAAPADVVVRECKCKGACKSAPVAVVEGPSCGAQKLKRVHPAEAAQIIANHLAC